jgi:hypothetical protein
MIYDVYFNLSKKLYSLRPCEGPNKGKVIGHCTSVSMRDVQFRVSEASRQRVLRDRQKNVHATARGIVTHAIGENISIDNGKEITPNHAKAKGKRVTYCPYRSGSFQTVKNDTFEDIESAAQLLLDTNGNRYAID